MSRKYEIDPDALWYIQLASVDYKDAKDFCGRFENVRINFASKIGLNLHAFEGCGRPDVSVFDIKVADPDNQALLNRYLFQREQIYVLESAISSLPVADQTIARLFYIQRKSGKEVAALLNQKPSTVSEKKRRALSRMADFTVNYFNWKYAQLGHVGLEEDTDMYLVQNAQQC